ncbi:MAG: ABC transporter substrate-binding protein [Hyphomicrobiales bacterium]|nr:ABC transporter substrate-binding protein [Hyphomicrobiales bacterium]
MSAAVMNLAPVARAAGPVLHIKIGLIRMPHTKDTISIMDVPPADDTLAGARMAIDDDNTTGTFLNQSFELVDEPVARHGDPLPALQDLAAKGVHLVITDLHAADLLKVASASAASDMLFFNATSEADNLREQDCRANIIHVAPERQMLTDAVAQYLIVKQWPHWFLVKGSHKKDALLAADYLASAKKFGANIVGTRTFVDKGGGRRSDSGLVQTSQLMGLFTQQMPAYDVLVAADESHVFASYLPYTTWDPRPVAGSGGLEPKTWDFSHEAWGAAQMQNRFAAKFHRSMTEHDNEAWVAGRMIGQAVSKLNTADPAKLRALMISPKFDIADYKGVPLSLRSWDQQLRQPILLSDGRMVVSASPQKGFLNPVSTLDTLGFDKPETRCKLP